MNIKFDYELLDSGNFYRLERFGNKVLARPESIAIWQSQVDFEKWKYDVIANLKSQGQVDWVLNKSQKNWVIDCEFFKMNLQLGQTRNIGIFPEQYKNWCWIRDVIGGSNKKLNILNLFGYTGGATLAAVSAGASVCHVDAAKSIVAVAVENQKLSGFEGKPIRWIVDDCTKFVLREIKRGVKYDGIILDPPAFGRGKNGEMFKFEHDVPKLLELCKQLLSSDAKFLLLNCYSMGYTPTVAYNLLKDIFPQDDILSGELDLIELARGYKLPCGVYAKLVKI